jgi:hypothetical protein
MVIFQVLQLRSIIAKLTDQKKDNYQLNGRSFDFNLYTKRHVLLHVTYLGWDYHGYAVQVWEIFFLTVLKDGRCSDFLSRKRLGKP